MRVCRRLLLAELLLATVACGGSQDVLQVEPVGPTSSHALVNQTISAAETDIMPSLGYGWDRAARRFTTPCIAGESKKADSAREGRLNVTRVMEASEAINRLGFGADAKAHYSIFSGSMRAQAARSLTTGKHSYVWAFSSEYAVDGDELDLEKKIRLTLPGKIADSQGKWNDICGDEFVHQIKRGAMFLLVYRLDFDSMESKKQVEAAMRAQVSDIAEVNANLKSFKSLLNNHAVLSIEAYQFGGDPTRITGMFSKANATIEEETAASKAIVKCSANDLESCDTFLVNAVFYGTSLADANAFPQQAAKYPNPVGYSLSPWAVIGKGATRNLTHDALEASRRTLAGLFDEAVANRRRLELIQREAWAQGPQAEGIDGIRLQLSRFLAEVSGAVSACYDDVEMVATETSSTYSRQSVERCANLVTALEGRRVVVDSGIGRTSGERALLTYWFDYNQGRGEDPTVNPVIVGRTTCGRNSGIALCVSEAENGTMERFILMGSALERYKQPGMLEKLGRPIESERPDKKSFGGFNRFERGVLHTGPAGTFFMSHDIFNAWQDLPDKWLKQGAQYPLGDEGPPPAQQAGPYWGVPGTRMVYMYPSISYIGNFYNWSLHHQGWAICAEYRDGWAAGHPAWQFSGYTP